jgi:hypothetical protein
MNPIPAVGVKSPWITNFEFVGTIDNSPYLCIPSAIAYRESIGGEKAIMEYCTQLAKDAAKRTAEIFETEVLDNKTGTLTNCCLSNVRLPLDYRAVVGIAVKAGMAEEDVAYAVKIWMQKTIVDEYDTFTVVLFYAGSWWTRWSGQVYLELADFEWGAGVLKKVCERVMKGEFVKPVVGSKL